MSREDFERLKNFQEPETNGVVSPEVCFVQLLWTRLLLARVLSQITFSLFRRNSWTSPMWATPSSPLLASWGEEPSPGGGRRRPGSIPSPRSQARRRGRRGRPATARTPLWRLMSAGSWTREPPGRDWRVWQRVWGSLRNAAAWAAVRAPPLSLYQPSTIPVTVCWRSKVSWPAQQQPILLFPHSRVFPAAVHQVPFSVPQGEKENGHRPQPGDEHSLQILVILSQRKFQQKNVLGVPEACMGGRVLWIQVGKKI